MSIGRKEQRPEPRTQVNRPMNPGDEAAEGTPGTGEDLCPDCAGKGTRQGKPCITCGGTGRIVQGIGGG